MAKKITPNRKSGAKASGASGAKSKNAKAKAVLPKAQSAAKSAAPKKAPPQAARKPAPLKTGPKKSAPAKAAKPVKLVKAAPPKAAVKKAAPIKKAIPVKKVAPVKKAAPKTAAPKAPAKKAPAVQAAGKKVPPVKAIAPKPTASSKDQTPSTFKTQARRLAARRIETKRVAAKETPAPKPAPIKTVNDLAQPTGMYNGIVVTHSIKPFPAKNPYTKDELTKLRASLLEERDRLLTQLASLSGMSMDAMVSAKENSAYSVHIAEHATDLQTAEANMGVRTIEEDRLEEVEEALGRIKNSLNHFGLCMACGNKIGIQRLIARPHALLCMPCRKRYEEIRARRGY